MISAVVPVYNSINTLERCVGSLCGQTYKDLEVILVEDSSDDGSDRLCDDLALRFPQVSVIHKENEGVSAARNAGMDAAKGEYIFFTDSDDYVEPDMAEKLLAALGDADLALCGFHHHYRGRDVVKIPSAKVAAGSDEGGVFLGLYGQGFLNMPWNKLFRKERAGRFETGISLGEDLLFNLDYLKKGCKISVVMEALCHYIQDDTGKSLSSKKRDDRFLLAKSMWRETGRFYESLVGHPDKSGVIDTRFVQDVLDDVEALPFDRSANKVSKYGTIWDYCKDPDFKKASKTAVAGTLDYRIVLACMKAGLVRLTYFLCFLRSLLVRMGVHNG